MPGLPAGRLDLELVIDEADRGQLVDDRDPGFGIFLRLGPGTSAAQVQTGSGGSEYSSTLRNLSASLALPAIGVAQRVRPGPVFGAGNGFQGQRGGCCLAPGNPMA